MVSVTPTARNIESAAESLREDLTRLEIQKQALERELAAVSAHLGSVQRALDALQALMPGSGPAATPPGPAAPPSPAKPKPTRAGASAVPADENPAKAKRSNEDGDDGKTYGRLTEQILAYFAQSGDDEVRARDVASALGRDTDSGSINAIRSTLDRLVGASRIQRVGRGLYRAVKP
ncbi:hypothetical protein GCM10010329_34870 [Streptomyces spiroverticillatus]|uniref:Uncharacterized protein n=1 Tax=Streptomyces finlayi TaxID=67296 RepID=A0A918WWT2_9ACTN|nr:hypothetical protein [Streptomyces finlayi]GHA09031.1 hypothetical protein GCM10010329_34870 [Streptomyces spiroverticillatus]GHC91829.1 hypothetical protein GCM10010334_27280 [Streptomyces finlayi]